MRTGSAMGSAARSGIVGLSFGSGYNRRLTHSRVQIKMSLRLCLLAASLVVASGPGLAAEGDAAAGEIKAYTCSGCHGIPGYNNVYPTYKVPKVAGQNYNYLVLALTGYRNGERDHPTMESQASSLSDQDIRDISAYFANSGKDQ